MPIHQNPKPDSLGETNMAGDSLGNDFGSGSTNSNPDPFDNTILPELGFSDFPLYNPLELLDDGWMDQRFAEQFNVPSGGISTGFGSGALDKYPFDDSLFAGFNFSPIPIDNALALPSEGPHGFTPNMIPTHAELSLNLLPGNNNNQVTEQPSLASDHTPVLPSLDIKLWSQTPAPTLAPTSDGQTPLPCTNQKERQREPSSDENGNKRVKIAPAPALMKPDPDPINATVPELFYILSESSPIFDQASTLAQAQGLTLPGARFLSSFIFKHQITGREFLSSTFWTHLLGRGSALDVQPAQRQRLAGLTKMVEAARSRSPGYKDFAGGCARALGQPLIAAEAHKFKLRPSRRILKAVAKMAGPMRAGDQAATVAVSGGHCLVEATRREGQKLVTWFCEPEVVSDDEDDG